MIRQHTPVTLSQVPYNTLGDNVTHPSGQISKPISSKHTRGAHNERLQRRKYLEIQIPYIGVSVGVWTLSLWQGKSQVGILPDGGCVIVSPRVLHAIALCLYTTAAYAVVVATNAVFVRRAGCYFITRVMLPYGGGGSAVPKAAGYGHHTSYKYRIYCCPYRLGWAGRCYLPGDLPGTSFFSKAFHELSSRS